MIVEHRKLEPELIDDPELDHDQHDEALEGLKRLNLASRCTSVFWSAIQQHAKHITDEPVRVLDVASGGGDIVVALSHKAHRSGQDYQIDGCDFSANAVSYANRIASERSPLSNQFFCRDVVRDGLPEGYHIIMCSLFLHHLPEQDAVTLLRSMADSCQHSILVDDLRRTRLGYVLAWTGCHLLTRSPIVHSDGPQSVRAAFRDDEVEQLAASAGLTQYQLRRHWPQRFLLSWSKQ
jgi:2-polyprenyl-3-methyl-5-hydroxy-6-metoxy-1,4-benzoquinol methylase